MSIPDSPTHPPCNHRTVPFTTRRPTFSETKRVARILISVYRMPATSAPSQPCAKAPGEGAVPGKPAPAKAEAQRSAAHPGTPARGPEVADLTLAEPEAPHGLSKKQKAKARAARSRAAAKVQGARGDEAAEQEPTPEPPEPVVEEDDILGRAAALAAATANAARKG